MTLADIRRNAIFDVVPPRATSSVAVVGLGYVGLPTAVAFTTTGRQVAGIDISNRRINAILEGDVELLEHETKSLAEALSDATLSLSLSPESLIDADVVIICVPTPIDQHAVPDLGPLRSACQMVVEHARQGQLILLTSTTYVGCTNDLLAQPLRERGLAIGKDVWLAFAPERIDPGNTVHDVRTTPRVVGGVTPDCSRRAHDVLTAVCPEVVIVSSPEAAEMTKLHENTFRSVNIAYVNELAEACRSYDLDVTEVVSAAATKPYGFMPFTPGPGVGGHCLPCDPHYLLWHLRSRQTAMPIVEAAMAAIRQRPAHITDRVMECLQLLGKSPSDARVLVWGLTYKPNVADIRESPAMQIVDDLGRRGVAPQVHDSLVPDFQANGRRYTTVANPRESSWDAVVVCTIHADDDVLWATEGLGDVSCVVDATYRLTGTRVVRP